MIGGIHVIFIGRSGGIVVMWDKMVWKGGDRNKPMVACKFEGINQVSFSCVCLL